MIRREYLKSTALKTIPNHLLIGFIARWRTTDTLSTVMIIVIDAKIISGKKQILWAGFGVYTQAMTMRPT